MLHIHIAQLAILLFHVVFTRNCLSLVPSPNAHPCLLFNLLLVWTYSNRARFYRSCRSKETFNREISLFRSKLNTELRKKLVRCYVWSIAVYHSDLDTKKIGEECLKSFEMWCWRRMEKIKWPDKVTNE